MQPLLICPPIHDPADIGRVRAQVGTRLAGLDHHRRQLVELVVSELVTNALLHAGGTRAVRVTDLGDRLRIEVDDEATDRIPRPRSPADWDVTGRGLRIVEQLAERWGTDLGDGVKTVWCEIRPARLPAGG